jgi:outer membrane protein TolC
MVREAGWILLIVLASGCQAARTAVEPQSLVISEPAETAGVRPASVSRVVTPVRPELAGPVSLDVVVAEVLRQHGGVQAAQKRMESASRRVTVAGSLQDPMLEIDNYPQVARSPQYQMGRMTSEVMLSQQVPWYGKRDRQACAAQAEVQAARAELQALQLQVREEAERAWYELFYAQQMLNVVREDQQVLENLLQVAEARYETGRAGQQEVLRLQAEQATVSAELLRLQQVQQSARAELARLMQISPETPLMPTETLDAAGTPLELEDLYERAIQQRPELQVVLAEINREQQLAERARLDYYPDVSMRLGWGRMTDDNAMVHHASGRDNVSVGFGVNVPVNHKRLRASVQAAEASVVAATRDYDRLKAETQRDVKQLFSQAVSQRDSAELLRDSVIPKTEQALRAALRGYQVDATAFSDLISTWRELLKFHVAQLQMELQYRQTLATLERVVGGGGVVQPVAEAEDGAAIEFPSEAAVESDGAAGDRLRSVSTSSESAIREVSALNRLKANYRRRE